jgi:hypothetical protein
MRQLADAPAAFGIAAAAEAATRLYIEVVGFFAGFLYALAGFFFFAVLAAVFCAANAPSDPTMAGMGRTTAAPNAAAMAEITSFFTGCLRS